MFRCSSIAPLATPVVPPVYCRNARSSCAERHVLELRAAALGERGGQPDRARQVPRRHHLLHVAEHEVDDEPLEAQQLADARDDDFAHLRLRHDLLQRMREVLDDDDHFGAGVVQLVLELARRVQRVHVHDRAAGAQRSEEADRVLQDVGHHQRDARPLAAALRLQPGGERGRQRVELAERDRLAHARDTRAARRTWRRSRRTRRAATRTR